MNNSVTIETIDGTFLARLDPDGKLKLTSCLQCSRCSAGCTMRQETDILPHQLNRMAALGMKDQLLASKAIWACASCHTCVSRCPMGVNTPELVDKLREMAQNVPSGSDVDRIRIFNNAMLGSMKRFGRVYEFAMMGEYKMRTRDFFSDLAKFPTMILKGKMKLFPPVVGGRKAVSSIFDRVRHTRRAK
jgi:heterodisulfide reductase subunit C2